MLWVLCAPASSLTAEAGLIRFGVPASGPLCENLVEK